MPLSRAKTVAGALACALALGACGAAESTGNYQQHDEASGHSETLKTEEVNHSQKTVNGDGSKDTVEGVQLEIPRNVFDAGKPEDFELRIIGKNGKPITEYSIKHEHPLHLFFISLNCDFIHVHPEMREDGTWVVKDHEFPEPSNWAVVAEFSVPNPAEVSTATSGHFQLGGGVESQGGERVTEWDWTPTTSATVDGYTVTLNNSQIPAGQPSQHNITITRKDGKTVQLQEHMGSLGHLIAFNTLSREKNTLRREFVHTHSLNDDAAGTSPEPTLNFSPIYPGPGSYRVVIQFKTDGQVRDAHFFVYASANGEPYNPQVPLQIRTATSAS